ncbi:type II/IV secretion system protein [Candidatus Sumerlaeota bacterium]|nr:type II/IV secretion system protein [Candidatus Sumerlaeota bacterium]
MPLLEQIAPLIESVPRDENRAVEVVNRLLNEALRRDASDLHLECKRDALVAKMRLDGRLHVAARIGLDLRSAVLTRLKVMSQLVIYQSSLPQDGRFEMEWQGTPIQCRVAFLPTLHGEKVVIRLPERGRARMELADLGMREDFLKGVEEVLEGAQGAVLLTGPSSSGKTTTIYAMLKALWRMRGEAANIATLEDPIEADLGVVSQTQVRAEQGLTFEKGLRTLLRQDPDVMMIGEMRDAATAHTGIEAALTGHLVISTIHSGRASGVFVRLLDMGVEPYLVASAVRAAIAQRLVRRLCAHCRIERPETPTAPFAGVEKSFGPGSCEACDGIGYKGRTGVFESIRMDDALSRLILDRAPESRLRDLLSRVGNFDMTADLAAKVREGATSVQEALLCLR